MRPYCTSTNVSITSLDSLSFPSPSSPHSPFHPFSSSSSSSLPSIPSPLYIPLAFLPSPLFCSLSSTLPSLPSSLTSLPYTFPLKVSSWPVGGQGFLYDREWMVLSEHCSVLSQKQEPRLCFIQPSLDLSTQTMTLTAKGMQGAGRESLYYRVSLGKRRRHFVRCCVYAFSERKELDVVAVEKDGCFSSV